MAPGLFHHGYWLGVDWVSHPQMSVPSLGRSTRGQFSTMPWHGCDIPWQSQLSLGTLAGGAHPHAHVYVCVPPYCTRVHTVHTHHVHPQTHVCTLRFPGTPRGMRSDNPPPRHPPLASLWGTPPPPQHTSSRSRAPCSACVSFSHPGSRTLSHVPTPVHVDSSSRQRLAG